MKDQYLKKDHIMAGQTVSTDNYIYWYPVNIYYARGNSTPYDMLSGGCVFVEHTSVLTSINNQVDINSTETVKSKLIFDKEAQIKGVTMNGYQTYNGRLSASYFREELLKKQRRLYLSGLVPHVNLDWKLMPSRKWCIW